MLLLNPVKELSEEKFYENKLFLENFLVYFLLKDVEKHVKIK